MNKHNKPKLFNVSFEYQRDKKIFKNEIKVQNYSASTILGVLFFVAIIFFLIFLIMQT